MIGHRRRREVADVPGPVPLGAAARAPGISSRSSAHRARCGDEVSEPRCCTLRVDKWDGSASKSVRLEALESDGFGRWYRWPAGAEMTRRGGPPVRYRRDQIVLVPVDEHWIARWGLDGDHALYCDVTTPVTTSADGTLHTVDLDLDVVRYRDGRVAVLDRDQFEARRRSMGYPAPLVARAMLTTRRLHHAIRRGREPFAAAGPGRLTPISAEAMSTVARRVIDRVGADDSAQTRAIHQLVRQTGEEFRDATVTTHLPVLIERAVRRRWDEKPRRSPPS